VHQHAGIAGCTRKPLLDLESVIAEARIADQMSARLAEAYQHSVADGERIPQTRVGVARGNIDVPARQILTVEQVLRLFR